MNILVKYLLSFLLVLPIISCAEVVNGSLWDTFYGQDTKKFTQLCMSTFYRCDKDRNKRVVWEEYRDMLKENAGLKFKEEVARKEYEKMSGKYFNDGVGIRQFCTFISDELKNNKQK